MWFVMHVKPGCEAQAVELLKSTSKSDLLEEVFCPMSECQRREDGEYVDDMRPMIDGAVFVVAPGKREVRACTRHAMGLEAIYDAHPGFEPMQDGEEDFVNLWAAPSERVCDMSEGWIDKAGFVTLSSGPLFERQGDIQKISKNRRWAFVPTSITGKPARARAAVRITRNDHLHPWER